MKKILMLTLALSTLAHAEEPPKVGYRVDQVVCETRASIGKATAEARDRHTPLVEWRREITLWKVYGGDPTSALSVVLPLGIRDIDEVYKKRKLTPREIYLDLFHTCREQHDQILLATGEIVNAYNY